MLHNLLLFFFSVVATRISGIIVVAISACSGESVKLFNIMSFTLNESVVSLYVNASKFSLTAMSSKGTIEKNVEKVSLDEYGNVWIHNITLSDERKYKVLHSINGTYPDLWDAQLTVWVAPSNSCRPQVALDGNTLIASLQVSTGCGKPEAVPYWLQYPDLTYNGKTKATLTPGRKAGTYYACIETPALRCARSYNISDFCSSFAVYESSHPKPLTDSILILVSTVLGLVGVFAAVAIFCFLRRKPLGRLGSKEESHPMTNDDNIGFTSNKSANNSNKFGAKVKTRLKVMLSGIDSLLLCLSLLDLEHTF